MHFEGRRLGRYLLHCLIGRNGIDEIYLARDQHISRQVAVKPFQSDKYAKGGVCLFLRKAYAIAILRYPYFVALQIWRGELRWDSYLLLSHSFLSYRITSRVATTSSQTSGSLSSRNLY